jgi:Flp pilus assembly secretin CpaC
MSPRPFATIQIIEPNIVDAIALSNRRISLIPKEAGITTVSILGERNDEIARFSVSVSAIEKTREVSREAYAGVPGRVEVHNHPTLIGSTVFSCGTTCVLVKEIQSEVPPPAPPNAPAAHR